MLLTHFETQLYKMLCDNPHYFDSNDYFQDWESPSATEFRAMRPWLHDQADIKGFAAFVQYCYGYCLSLDITDPKPWIELRKKQQVDATATAESISTALAELDPDGKLPADFKTVI